MYIHDDVHLRIVVNLQMCVLGAPRWHDRGQPDNMLIFIALSCSGDSFSVVDLHL